MSPAGPLFLITGVPGAGKTNAAQALMRRFRRGIHIPVDDLREWVVSGIAHPVPAWTEETTRQFDLARRAACAVAEVYAAAGFAVALDDVILPREAEAAYGARLAARRLHKVLLRPALETALERNASRANKAFNPSVLVEPIRALHAAYAAAGEREGDWLIIDTSRVSIDETADLILRTYEG